MLQEDLNSRPMKKYGGVSRRQLFHRIERTELRPLPTERFEFCEWKQPRVNIDYHVGVDRHYYSVPSTLVGEIVDARFTASTVELLHHGKRVASHVRSFVAGKHTTKTEHMPKSHQKHAEWTPSRIITWATETGPRTAFCRRLWDVGRCMTVSADAVRRIYPDMERRSLTDGLTCH